MKVGLMALGLSSGPGTEISSYHTLIALIAIEILGKKYTLKIHINEKEANILLHLENLKAEDWLKW
jgi:hypothetical protein